MTINHQRVTYTLTQLYAEQGYCEEAEDCLENLAVTDYNPEKASIVRQIIKEKKEAKLKALISEWVACIRNEGAV